MSHNTIEVLGRPWSHPVDKPGWQPNAYMLQIPSTAAQWQSRIGYTPDHCWNMQDSNLPLVPTIGARTLANIASGTPAYEPQRHSPWATQFDFAHGGGVARIAASGDTTFLESGGATDLFYLMEGYFPAGNNTYLWYKADAGAGNRGYQVYRTPANAFVVNIDEGASGVNVPDPGWNIAGRAILCFGYSQTNNIGYLVILDSSGRLYQSSVSIAGFGSMISGGYALSNPGTSLGNSWSFLAGFANIPLTLAAAVTMVKKLL
jgi:hypothetical protein